MGALKDILNATRATRAPLVSMPPAAPAPSPPKAVAVAAPDPAIVRTCHYGVDRMPARYRDAWLSLLDQRPCGVTASAWKQAIADTRTTFGDWGRLIRPVRLDGKSRIRRAERPDLVSARRPRCFARSRDRAHFHGPGVRHQGRTHNADR